MMNPKILKLANLLVDNLDFDELSEDELRVLQDILETALGDCEERLY
ncbi:hypothetical protein QP248_02725 [Aerococcus sp. UMB8608]|nr:MULTISPECIES: hypothetical protein [Aerococcus]MDK6679364.1 hypothetical protein [Aerococcus sp. UMB8608]MDK6685794.1 hypothetical protein [Aerococcus sp. UMB8623]